ncbi:MAG: diguanylate cyclase domain-containing protein [Acidimicrobiales bacterium]
MALDPIQIDEVPVPLLEVRDGVVMRASAMATALLVPAAEDAQDRRPAVAVGRPLADLIAEPDRPALEEALVAGPARRSGDRLPGTRQLSVRLIGPPSRPVTLSIVDTEDVQLVGIRDLRIERRLAAVIDAVADSTLLLDADGRLLWQSDALAARVPGGRANLGTHPVERLHPEDLPLVLENFAELSRHPTGRVSQVVRSRAVDDDDVWQLIELIGAGRPDHPDLGGVVVQVRNLDEGAELESVAHTDGPLMSLAEAAPIGILLMNHTEQVVYANRASRDLLALAESDDASRWREHVAASHRGLIDAMIAAGLAAADPVTTTAPFTRPEGSAHWLRVRIAPHLGASGRVLGVIAALEDVTAEVEARTQSERLLQMLDATSDFVAVFKRSGEILHTNVALQQVLERLEREGGSGRLADLLGEASRDRFLAGAVGALEGRDSWQGELQIRVGGGQTIPVSALGVVRRDEDGEVDWIAMVARDISSQKDAQEVLRRMATIDHLTGLANRALFTEQLEEAAASSQRSGRPLALLFCDLDRFKEVNDRHGHAVGDTVLRTIADRLQEITREGDLAARVGGDEFVILCQGVTDSEVLATLAERIIDSIDQPIVTGDAVVKVGISIGIAVATGNEVDGDRLLIVSDQAMYRAKATGGNRYRILSDGPT